MKVKPFVKWAGGKTQVIKKIIDLLPDKLKNNEINTYIEPFVGGGALLFYILQNYHIKNAVINDVNKELINCYLCIKLNVKELINSLKKPQHDYLNSKNRSKFYFEIRDQYNQLELSKEFTKNPDIQKASQFIFLNKTCFNGLYRVNKSGLFNVPHGVYKNPLICDENNLLLCSKLLQNVKIVYGDYSDAIKNVKENDLVYFDPPYRPLLKNKSFVGYSKFGFDDEDQKKLASEFKRISLNNCYAILSNSDPKNTDINDNFFDDLYKNFKIIRIEAKRSINANGNKRGKISELIIKNY